MAMKTNHGNISHKVINKEQKQHPIYVSVFYGPKRYFDGLWTW